MKLKLKKDIKELNSLSLEEREEFNNVFDLFEIEIPKDERYIKIDTKLKDLLCNNIMDILLYITTNCDADYINEYLYEYFEGINLINYSNWRFHNKDLNIEFLNCEDLKIISMVILNYLINEDDNIYINFGCTNLNNFLIQLLNVIYNDNLHNFLNLEYITFLG